LKSAFEIPILSPEQEENGEMTDLQIRVFAPQSGVYRVEARLNESARFDGEARFDTNALREQDNDPTNTCSG